MCKITMSLKQMQMYQFNKFIPLHILPNSAECDIKFMNISSNYLRVSRSLITRNVQVPTELANSCNIIKPIQTSYTLCISQKDSE